MADSPSSGPPGVPRGRAPAPTGRLNSLGMSKRELDALLDEIDAPAKAHGAEGGAPGRRFVRRAFRQIRLPMQISQPGGHVATFPVACRNISRTGVSVLHSAYIHPGTRCTIALPGTGGRSLTVTGAVARCEHRRGMVHEVGVAFDRPVDVRRLLDLDRTGDWYSLERVDPEELDGKILCVDDCAVDRQLIRQHLKDTTLLVTPAEDTATALTKAATGFDLILCAYHMPGLDGPGFVEQLRARGIATPVIMLAHDAEPATRSRLARLPSVALLTKPVPRDLLLRAIAEFLIVSPQRPGAAGESAAAILSGEPMRELMAEFLRDLPRLAESLRAARAAEDREGCRQICMKVRGSARPLGLGDLAHIADLAVTRLAGVATLAEAAAELDRVLAACPQPEQRRAS